MGDSSQVSVSSSQSIPEAHKSGNGSGQKDFTLQVLVDTRLENSSQVNYKTILVAVLLPVVVAVYRSTELALLFSRRHVGQSRQAFERIPSGRSWRSAKGSRSRSCHRGALYLRVDKSRYTANHQGRGQEQSNSRSSHDESFEGVMTTCRLYQKRNTMSVMGMTLAIRRSWSKTRTLPSPKIGSEKIPSALGGSGSSAAA